MSSPIYFFPGVRPLAIVDRDRLRFSFLEGRGVAAAFAGVKSVQADTCCVEITGKGPSGRTGTMLVATCGREPPLHLTYAPDHQTWIEGPAGADCWVCLAKDHPPTPADLARSPHPQGRAVELGDGNKWHVPILRSPFDRESHGRSHLPRDFYYDKNGQLAMRLQADSERLWELSGVAWDHYLKRDEHPTIDSELLMELAIGALAINYRVGKVEATLLGPLIGSANWEAIVEAILDFALVNEMLELQKKSAEQPAPG